jgi:hydrogenase/urease accessory protein HupE
VTYSFQSHANVQALLEAAVRASFPLGFVDNATLISHARVDFLVLHSALEEPLARFAGQQAVVVAGYLIAADRTKFLKPFLGVRVVALAYHSIVHRSS